MTNRFNAAGHFEASAPNDHRMTLNTTMSKYTIYVLLVSVGTKFQSAVFGVACHFETSATNNPQNDLEHPNAQIWFHKMISLYNQLICRTFYSTPLTTMLNGKKKKE